MIHSVSYSGRL